MSKNSKRKNLAFSKTALSVAAIATSLILGFSATACTDDDDTENTTVSTKQDSQVLKNGNFEFYDDNDGYYYISSPDNWSGSSNGTSSDSLSGVIKTDSKSWSAFTDTSLPDVLEANDDLDSDDDDKIDYNGVLTDDLPYKNTHAATSSSATDTDKAYISNPFTHEYSWNDDGELVNLNGEVVKTYTNTSDEDNDAIYLDADCTTPLESSVLMIHNYVDGSYGTEYYYSSSTTLTLTANTAAKISFWVKTDQLYFAGSTGSRTQATDSIGAYFKVDQTVGGTSLDSFYIKNINTQQLQGDNVTNNGWVQYNIYVQACDYAETTLKVTCGLGENSRYVAEGYAFFDDITYTSYSSLDELKEENGFTDTSFNSLITNTTAKLSSTADEMKFRTDTVTVKTNTASGDVTTKEYQYFSKYYDYFIDLNLASSAEALKIDSTTSSAGLTVDTSNYVCAKLTDSSKYYINGITETTEDVEKAYMPRTLGNGLDISDDILANISITSDSTWNAGLDKSNYNDLLTSALKTAVDLPAAGDTANALVMLSARGAAYTAKITDSTNFTVDKDQYKIISFWVKTSDMNGNTAATITVTQYDENNKATTNTASFTVDSTTISTTEIGDNEDYYNGWVQCFILVSNTVDIDYTPTFDITVNFGLTTIKDTSSSAYHGGWVALTNFTIIDVDSDTYGYISSDLSATLSISDNTTTSEQYFDTEFGDYGKISENVVRPASYNGANGGSAYVTNEVTTISDFDELNRNVSNVTNGLDKNYFAGLVNKDTIEYAITNSTYLKSAIKALSSITDTEEAWSALVGVNSYSVQPLLIVNTVRTVSEELEAGLYNYGYVGSSSTFSSDSYTAVSVKVRVSEGAIAKVYLVDPDEKTTLNFKVPEYTFWYDDDGNVLITKPDEDATQAEQVKNIAYTLQDNGLYMRDGKYYANLYNLSREYYDESLSYYDANGNFVNYDDIDADEIYFSSADKTAYVAHYLVTDDGDRVYFYNSGLGTDAEYYYVVDSEPDEDLAVKTFDINVASLRYTETAGEEYPYVFTIDAINNKELANQWITVNFYIHTGSESKSYRLELWSGSRELATADEGTEENSYVLFDYSLTTMDESTYEDLRSYYTDNIINDYRNNILKDTSFASNDENISYYEQLAGKDNLSTAYKYQATYYTYTLYDSSNYYPFNQETAEDTETGYDYTYSDYSESLAYLYIEDLDSNKINSAMYMFVDYATLDQEISVGRAEDVDDDDDDDDDDSGTTIWLLISSICLVAAIFVAIFAILIRDIIKRAKRRKTAGSNSYNYKKNKRYVRKYVKANGEAPVASATDEKAEATAHNAEQVPTPAEPVQTAETTEEATAEQAPEAEAQPEQTSEEPQETTEDKPDDENK